MYQINSWSNKKPEQEINRERLEQQRAENPGVEFSAVIKPKKVEEKQ